MFTKISVLVPTRKRLRRLDTLLNSFHATAAAAEDIVFRVDQDDAASIDFLVDYQVVVGQRLSGYDSMPTFFNELAAAASGDVLMCGNDDMVFRTEGWAPKILEEANKYPDGLFNLGVSTHNETHFPFSTVSRKIVERLGFIWDPTIFWGDIYLRDVMAWFGRSIMVPDVQIDHDWAGYVPDEVFLQANKDIANRMPRYWQQVHAPAVAAAVQKLQGVMA